MKEVISLQVNAQHKRQLSSTHQSGQVSASVKPCSTADSGPILPELCCAHDKAEESWHSCVLRPVGALGVLILCTVLHHLYIIQFAGLSPGSGCLLVGSLSQLLGYQRLLVR